MPRGYDVEVAYELRKMAAKYFKHILANQSLMF